MPDYFLGVDGGQSSTVAVIGDESGKVIGWASAGPSNHVGAAEGRGKFLRVMRECLDNAVAPLGIRHFRAACLGMSGGPEDKHALLREIVTADHLLVTHDARIALAGATGGKPGTIVIAGTGSIAFGENAQGETARAGGWGYVFGDEGGGFDIVRQALRATLREHEGWGPRTALTPALLEAIGSSDANHAMHLMYTAEWPRSRVAGLAALVNAIAEAGDPAAIGVLHHAASALAELALSVRRQLWRDNDSSSVSWIGGVFKSRLLQEQFTRLVEVAGAVAKAPEHSPALGALMIAWKAAGLEVLPEPQVAIKT